MAAYGALPAADMSQWRVEGPARMVPAGDGFLRVAYDSEDFHPIVLRPPLPMELPEDIRRVRLWYARMAGDFDIFLLLTSA